MSEELKPCPMCGGPGELSWYRSARIPHGQEKESDKAHVIKCLSCGLDGNSTSIPSKMQTAEQAAKLWNTRHITLDQAKQALAEAGMVAVLVEPTEAMIDGFWGEITHGDEERACAVEAYKAMTKAAQENPDA